MITFNNQQLDAIKLCVKWYFTESYRNNIFALAGLAGTGKSTVAKTIISVLGLQPSDVIFATFTGKASLVLRLKGNQSNTIHKTFYSVFKSAKAFSFSLKHHIPSNIKLIVIDEASMINQKMLDDISSFGCPVILLYDPGQLPAIFGANRYVTDPSLANVFLTQVMRQDDTSGILDLASMAREGTPLRIGKYKNSHVVNFNTVYDKLEKYDIVITYSNRLRRMVNAEIRKKLGYDTLYPIKGEKVLCLGNNYNYSFEFDDIPIYMINGMQGTVIADTEKEKFANVDVARLNFVPDFIYNTYGASKEHTFSIPCYREIFEQYLKDPSKQAFIETLYEEIDESVTSDICTIDYGYALTCHKSQGSEYDNVLVLVESKIPSNLYNKWLYTAITRAKKSVTVASVC